ncbi:MAG: 4-(cytidine 5'-diphospho)-2-C-methyl-D-erythritol kinase [Betaproteobacteria bacterium]|nr:4-(cytidine 5'-diphospho)-2-C-methyl-D-erythritol kinase [Betaproteobacteria bacterium]
MTRDDAGTVYPAPAKLNLFLHVTGRRPDGYHTLQTLFRFLDFGDSLRFEVRSDSLVRRVKGPESVAPESDLVVRAARALQARAGRCRGVDIHLEKRLPLGGGLGGGSSDAATTLIVLNRLWNVDLPREDLQRVALTLGADVPVFVFGHTALAEGVGELLQPVTLEPAWYVVLVPPVEVSTAAVFSHPQLTRNSDPIRMAAFFSGCTRNDLEPVVRALHPEVDDALRWLSQFGDARMSGSGACAFCGFATEAEARSVLAQRPAGWAGFVAAGVDEHPLRRLGVN